MKDKDIIKFPRNDKENASQPDTDNGNGSDEEELSEFDKLDKPIKNKIQKDAVAFSLSTAVCIIICFFSGPGFLLFTALVAGVGLYSTLSIYHSARDGSLVKVVAYVTSVTENFKGSRTFTVHAQDTDGLCYAVTQTNSSLMSSFTQKRHFQEGNEITFYVTKSKLTDITDGEFRVGVPQVLEITNASII